MQVLGCLPRLRNALGLMIAGILGACASASSAWGPESDLEQQLSAQLRRYPKLQAQDLYKLLHQSFFGPGHMVSDREAALAYLKKEVAGMPSASGALLREPLLGARFERVHLRAYLAEGGELEALADRFVEAAALPADRDGFERAAARAQAFLHKRGRSALASALDELVRASQGASYPARHHSKAYRQAYLPAYRVVKRSR